MKALVATIFCVSFVRGAYSLDINQRSWRKDIETKIEGLYTKYKHVENELTNQQKLNEQLLLTVAAQSRLIKELLARVKTPEKVNADKSRVISRYGRQERIPIAFSAYLDHEIDNLVSEQIVPFGAVELNEGGAYNNRTGVVTIAEDGVYMFTFSVEDYRGHRIWLKLVVDGNLKASVVEWSALSQNAQGSNTVFLRLKAGQRVWVAVDARESGDSLQGWADLRTTTFAGAYMFP